jgi:hypothetical protein
VDVGWTGPYVAVYTFTPYELHAHIGRSDVRDDRASPKYSIPFPVRLRVAYADGTTQDFSISVNVWARGNRFDAVLPARGPVTGVRLWPDPSVPDWNPSNDTWGNPPAANPTGPVTRK